MNRPILHLRPPLQRLLLLVAALLATAGGALHGPTPGAAIAPEVRLGGLSAALRVPGAVVPLPAAPVALAPGRIAGAAPGSDGGPAGPQVAHPAPADECSVAVVQRSSPPHPGGLPARLPAHHLSGYRANAPPVTG